MKQANLHPAAALVLLFGLSACNGATGPDVQGDQVQIYQNGIEYEEQTIAPGDRLTLTAKVLGADGEAVAGETVTWSSDANDVATVDGSGTVTGVGAGSARIIAMHPLAADTALVKVAAPLTGELSCAGVNPLVLQSGESRLLDGGDASSLCLPGGGTGASYQISAVNTGLAAGARLETRIATTGFLGGDGPSSPLQPSLASARIGADEAFHYRIRHDVSRRLEPLLSRRISPSEFASRSLSVAPGDLMDFNVESTSIDGCEADSIRMHPARIRWESRYAIIAADTLNPAGGYTDAEFREFGEFFDDTVWPLITGTFGTPSDIDRNQKVYVLFTRGVNERPENQPGTGITVGGFFFNRDLFPKDRCAGSNAVEMFYLLVPDPAGEAGRPFSKTAVARSNRSVLVHEFQHLVNDSRRLHVNQASTWEDTWLNEGLSHIAEELAFYRISGLSPRSNLGPEIFSSASVREAFDRYQIDNVSRLASFLRTPTSQSVAGSDVLATRGAAWHFLRYLADRTSNEAAFWRALVRDSRTAGFDNIRAATGADPRELLRMWGGTLSLDDTSAETEPYRFASWDLRAIYPALDQYWPSSYYLFYPLRVESLAGDVTPFSLRGGTAFYGAGDVAPGATAALRVSVGDLPAPSRLKVLVTRFR